jgi:hypothetical protein
MKSTMHEQDPEIRHNLFRNKARPDLYCAVPENRTVPAFIREPGWEFAGRISDQASAPAGFNRAAAWSAANFLGFYVFHLLPERRNKPHPAGSK